MPLVANPTGAAITQGLNTIPAHSIANVTLAAGDADALLTAGCSLAPTIATSTKQEGAFMLYNAFPR